MSESKESPTVLVTRPVLRTARLYAAQSGPSKVHQGNKGHPDAVAKKRSRLLKIQEEMTPEPASVIRAATSRKMALTAIIGVSVRLLSGLAKVSKKPSVVEGFAGHSSKWKLKMNRRANVSTQLPSI